MWLFSPSMSSQLLTTVWMLGVEEPGDVVAHLQVGDVDKGAGWGSEWLLTQDAHDQLAILHDDLYEQNVRVSCTVTTFSSLSYTELFTASYLGVPWWDVFVRAAVLLVRVGAVCADDVDVSWNDETEDLLACPEGTWLEDGWLGHFPVPGGEEHEEVHDFPLWRQNTQWVERPWWNTWNHHDMFFRLMCELPPVSLPSLRRHLSLWICARLWVCPARYPWRACWTGVWRSYAAPWPAPESLPSSRGTEVGGGSSHPRQSQHCMGWWHWREKRDQDVKVAKHHLQTLFTAICIQTKEQLAMESKSNWRQ